MDGWAEGQKGGRIYSIDWSDEIKQKSEQSVKNEGGVVVGLKLKLMLFFLLHFFVTHHHALCLCDWQRRKLQT